ncbi:MAG: phosphate ABC transporter substrate-binding/OmpA family protein [Planctomycetota bacterium]|nr:phosphate ABC transporter substrate-binding/OmpA family protein [Planctomycetota bacterium]
MSDNGTSLTPLGKMISILLILGLIGLGAWLILKPGGEAPVAQNGGHDPKGGPGPGPGPEGPEGPLNPPGPGLEAPDLTGVTTVKEYKYVPADKLPPVKGAANYKWDEKEKVVVFSYNVWAGWLPIIAANHGTEPNEESVFFKKYGFKVKMELIDDPVKARDAFAAGEVHALWGTVDMLTLFAPELMRDSRTAPRIVQQIDWSSGGDGIVVRSKFVRSVKDLKGKTVAFAPNSPSEYYLTSLLLSAGLKPSDITPKPTDTAFSAATAFVSEASIHACVSWAPDIYNISERIQGTKILSSTADANKLIADVYALRADFVRDHPEVVEGLIAGIFQGMDLVKADPAGPCEWMAKAFQMQQQEVMGMRQDFHTTNFAENVQFFLNASNPTNFERTWENACYVYRKLGRVDTPVTFDQVSDFSFIKKLEAKGTFKHQKDENVAHFTPGSFSGSAEAPILTQTIRINFFPNSSNPYEPARDPFGNLIQGKLYDPNADATLEQCARLSGQFDRAVVLIEGHTDASMKGKVPEVAVKKLSEDRANAVKQALIDKFKFDPNKFTVRGIGWEKPFDPNQPANHALNRRVEISIFPPEQQ